MKGRTREKRETRMAYTAEKRQVRTINSRIFAPSPDDEIVITGISGKFPNSKNLAEFSHNLYNKVNAAESGELIFFFGTFSTNFSSLRVRNCHGI